MNAVYDAGVNIPISAESDIDNAFPMILHAWKLAKP